jgi:cysteine desulfurase
MGPWQTRSFGNASSRDHAWGWDAANAVEDARAAVADAVTVTTSRVIFMSGATEAVNTVIRAYVGFDGWARKKLVTCAADHDAVLAPCRYLARRTGVRLDVLPVDDTGHVELADLEVSLASAPGALVALTAANNEIGTVHDVRGIAETVHAAGALFLCDTTQAVGKLRVDLAAAAVDFATISAHKLYGPKGVGALVARATAELLLDPLILGGGQEGGVRGGTLNVPGIVGFGEACRLVTECLDEDVRRMRALRDRLERAVLAEVSDTWVNGECAHRLCNTTNIGFKGVDARTLIRDMHDIAVSTRSACSSGHAGPSHVLKAIGLSDEDAYSCIRFSLGRFTTTEEVDYAIGKVVASVHRLRRLKSVRA